ncbi:MAG: hypothetical protein ACT4PW_14160 [Acidimicrobiia bacterium]
METILYAVLPFVGCAAMSVVCLRMMRRSDGRTDEADTGELARLRAEVTELRAARDAPGPGVPTDN